MDEFLVLKILKRRQREREKLLNKYRLRSIREAADPFAINDVNFKGLYCLSKEMARVLIEELRPFMMKAKRRSAIPLELKVLCALHFFAQGSYQKKAGIDSNLGLGQSSVSIAIDEVTSALNSDELLAKWIPFPLKAEERNKVLHKNYQSSPIPGVIGYIDGMHVAIKSPKYDGNIFFNNMSYYSLNVMIVCDSELKILNCLARFGGSFIDSEVWNESALKTLLMELWESGEQCWLLGDSDYCHQPWLQTPISNAQDGSPEAHYNSLHRQAWSTVERCIRLLKARFRCLLRDRALEYSPAKSGCIVNACIVLHNLCLTLGLEDPAVLPKEPDGGNLSSGELSDDDEIPLDPEMQEARKVRQNLVDSLCP